MKGKWYFSTSYEYQCLRTCLGHEETCFNFWQKIVQKWINLFQSLLKWTKPTFRAKKYMKTQRTLFNLSNKWRTLLSVFKKCPLFEVICKHLQKNWRQKNAVKKFSQCLLEINLSVYEKNWSNLKNVPFL